MQGDTFYFLKKILLLNNNNTKGSFIKRLPTSFLVKIQFFAVFLNFSRLKICTYQKFFLSLHSISNGRAALACLNNFATRGSSFSIACRQNKGWKQGGCYADKGYPRPCWNQNNDKTLKINNIQKKNRPWKNTSKHGL